MLGLSDEIAILPVGTTVLAGDSWFVIAPHGVVDKIRAEFPELKPVSGDAMRALLESPPMGDRADFCVGMIASFIEFTLTDDVGQKEQVFKGLTEEFPAAAQAARLSAETLADDEAGDDSIVINRRRDPFAFDVLLSEIVSPLKTHCTIGRG